MNRLGVIGAGNMGAAIINGINKSGMDIEVFAYDKFTEKLQTLPVTPCENEVAVVKQCKYILLAVKPQMLGEVLDTIAAEVTPDTVFISICAGISAEFIRKHTIANAKVVLVMPNTPMMLGLGASAMSCDDSVSEEEFGFARAVIGSCGITEVVPSDKMKEVIAINGSSPAFIYLYAKGFVDYAAEVGIGKDEALSLFAQTLVGSAKMLTDSGMTVDELIKQVSSPGGTTIAGVHALEEGSFRSTAMSAVTAAYEKTLKLKK